MSTPELVVYMGFAAWYIAGGVAVLAGRRPSLRSVRPVPAARRKFGLLPLLVGVAMVAAYLGDVAWVLDHTDVLLVGLLAGLISRQVPRLFDLTPYDQRRPPE